LLTLRSFRRGFAGRDDDAMCPAPKYRKVQDGSPQGVIPSRGIGWGVFGRSKKIWEAFDMGQGLVNPDVRDSSSNRRRERNETLETWMNPHETRRERRSWR
jgi:hypothetical protein